MQRSVFRIATIFLSLCAATASLGFGEQPPDTVTSLEFVQSATVIVGGAASAVVNVKTPNSSGSAVADWGTVTLLQVKSAGLPSSCADQNGRAEVHPGLSPLLTNGGEVSFDLQAAGLTASVGTIGYIAEYDDPGNYGKSASPCLDFTVSPAVQPAGVCDVAGVNATINAIRVDDGPGFPLAGESNTWDYVMRVRACVDLTNVTAQGGNNAWTGASFTPATGTGIDLRKKVGGKNTVNIWTIGSMSAGDEVDLGITVEGTIKANTRCGTVVGLLGSWSALSTSVENGSQKSAYSGTSTATVGPDPCP